MAPDDDASPDKLPDAQAEMKLMPDEQPDDLPRPFGLSSGTDWSRIIATIVCGLLMAITALTPIIGMFLHVSRDYGEGWNAYWALAAVSGKALYSADHVFITNNYPPLSFYLNGYLGALIGDQIIAGRLVALSATIGVAILIGHIVRRCGSTASWAWLSALVFLVYDLFFFRLYVAVNNPQWLAQAVMLTSVLPLLRVEPAALGWRRLAASTALMVIAGLIKHNQFALPMAVMLWLLIFNRRALAIWIALGVALASFACLLLLACYGPVIFTEIIGFRRTISVSTFLLALKLAGSLIPLMIVGIVAAVWDRKHPATVLFGLFAGLGVVLGLGQRFGNGVNVNAQFDGLIGLMILCGMFLGRGAAGVLAKPFPQTVRPLMLLAILIPPLITTPKHIKHAIADMQALPGDVAAWARMISVVHNSPDPVLCEYLAVCYWAGKPEILDFFAYGERLRTGTDPKALKALIATRKFSMIVVERDKRSLEGGGRLPAPFPALIGANYELDRAGPDKMDVMIRRNAASK
ncbi:ArnT family glycosyltransferase [Rhizosaccharibacter radicis]|uniref:Glycosyltransferase RgtA/B/C/D-like domain-containing protein n=1 Tax=Rhizosaccharibacter radicis TaxID=2782605 RepID=A0ABT1VT96_9PROT|nr:hypothetical protein [Acetobacteraceae bacterium KSS12]